MQCMCSFFVVTRPCTLLALCLSHDLVTSASLKIHTGTFGSIVCTAHITPSLSFSWIEEEKYKTSRKRWKFVEDVPLLSFMHFIAMEIYTIICERGRLKQGHCIGNNAMFVFIVKSS